MEKLYEGKSKVVYSSEEPGTCIIKYKDTATAGNGVKKEDLPGKGKLNAAISNIIFDYLMKNGVKTHLLKVIDETTVLAKKAEIVMVEVIVRNIAAGSFSKKYGVPEGSPLKNTVVEFSYKSDELGDPMINDSQITAIGLATQEELDELRAMSKRINELMTELFAAESSAKRMRSIMEEPIARGSEKFEPVGHDVVFDHVAFSYGAGEDGRAGEKVLTDVSFTAKEGEVTALVGPSGSGKSTVSRLAARFWDATEGTVTVGGVDVANVDPEVLLRDYAIVFQDVLLFDDTVMGNIRLGRRDATDEEVLAAARAANCDEFVSRMPQGYDTMIGENGSKLSGGERQRISIARALLKDAPIVLLDEATASLDVENETVVQQALSRLLAGKTVIVIAHRMRTVENADKIVVLKDGVVAEQGAPAQLKAAGGEFARMVALQKEAATWQL